MKTRILILVLAAVAGLLIGLAWHGRGRPAAPTTEGRVHAGSSPTPDREQIPGEPLPPSSDHDQEDLVGARDRRDPSMAPGVMRWLQWLEAIEAATPGDFLRLAYKVRDDLPSLELVAARWAAADPRHLFETLRRSPDLGDGINVIATVLFREWTRKDPEAVITALNEAEPFGLLQGWRRRVALNVFDGNVEWGLQLFSEWLIHDFEPRMTPVAAWAAADPRHAAQVALKYPAGLASEATLGVVGRQWARSAPAEALAFATGARGKLGDVLAEAVLKEWALSNREQAADWLASAHPSVRREFSPPFVETWAATDAEGALAWCETHLSGRGLVEAVRGVLTGAAKADPARAAGLVEQMRLSTARVEAALAVAGEWLPKFDSESPAPPEAIAWLNRLDSASLRRVLERTHIQWAQSDPASLMSFLEARGGEVDLPLPAYASAAANMARRDPVATLAWAERLAPDRRQEVGAGAFVEWTRAQPEAAQRWLHGLPDSDSRREPFLEQSVRMLVRDSESAAASLLGALPERDRAVARGVLRQMPMAAEKRQKLLDALETTPPP